MTINTEVIKLFLRHNKAHDIPLSNGLRLQVIPNISFLPRCQKHQFAAFISDRKFLVVWDDSPRNLLRRAARIQEELMEMVWEKEATQLESKAQGPQGENADGREDVERAALDERRPVALWQPFLVAMNLCITGVALGSGWREISMEIFVDHNYLRIAFLLAIPAQIWLAAVS